MKLLNFIFSEEKIENICIKEIIPKLKTQKIDTLFIKTSSNCKHCSKYNSKVYSLYGKNRSYPQLPSFLKKNNCPYCGSCIEATAYFHGVNSKPSYKVKASKNTALTDCISLNGVTINMYSLYCKYPNDRISAIKEFRKLTSCRLSEGKRYIDTYYNGVEK